MAKNTPSGKGSGGFSSSRNRRSRKHAVLVKKSNRARNAEGKAQKCHQHITT